MSRFYYEQDGDAAKGSCSNDHYIVDSYGNPCGLVDGFDSAHLSVAYLPSGSAMKRRALGLVKRMNKNPPWPVWDTVHAAHDCYVSPTIIPFTEEELRSIS